MAWRLAVLLLVAAAAGTGADAYLVRARIWLSTTCGTDEQTTVDEQLTFIDNKIGLCKAVTIDSITGSARGRCLNKTHYTLDVHLNNDCSGTPTLVVDGIDGDCQVGKLLGSIDYAFIGTGCASFGVCSNPTATTAERETAQCPDISVCANLTATAAEREAAKCICEDATATAAERETAQCPGISVCANVTATAAERAAANCDGDDKKSDSLVDIVTSTPVLAPVVAGIVIIGLIVLFVCTRGKRKRSQRQTEPSQHLPVSSSQAAVAPAATGGEGEGEVQLEVEGRMGETWGEGEVEFAVAEKRGERIAISPKGALDSEHDVL